MTRGEKAAAMAPRKSSEPAAQAQLEWWLVTTIMAHLGKWPGTTGPIRAEASLRWDEASARHLLQWRRKARAHPHAARPRRHSAGARRSPCLPRRRLHVDGRRVPRHSAP
mmetsp:Transcript_4862/g.11356  ORF Transcript_4862/g.11356 Transcript_4862/m.11356 type:complete len:110 (-) Transcript_4862:134-463(-)